MFLRLRSIGRATANSTPAGDCPGVHPIVLYNGARPWRAPTSLVEWAPEGEQDRPAITEPKFALMMIARMWLYWFRTFRNFEARFRRRSRVAQGTRWESGGRGPGGAFCSCGRTRTSRARTPLRIFLRINRCSHLRWKNQVPKPLTSTAGMMYSASPKTGLALCLLGRLARRIGRRDRTRPRRRCHSRDIFMQRQVYSSPLFASDGR